MIKDVWCDGNMYNPKRFKPMPKMCKNTTSQIMKKKITNKINKTHGIKQSDTISLKLFT